jgi:limonene-1,2-epoxide hydrolase
MTPQAKESVVLELLGLIDAASTTDDPGGVQRRILSLLAEDLVYQNHPQRRVEGLAGFAAWQREFAQVRAMRCEVLRIAVTSDWVLTERVDSWIVDGVEVRTPLMGSFEVRADGKVHAWVDYLPYTEAWRASGQMRPGFFEEWSTDEEIVRQV